VTADRTSPPTAPSLLVARVGAWPGVRTLHSSRFRLVIGISLWAVGLAVLGTAMAHQMIQPNGGFGIDFTDYRAASLRLFEGRSPYAPEMLEGPVAAQGIDRYRYPPVFAQLLTPLAILPSPVGAVAWAALQVILLFAATWVAGTAAGARPSLARFVWTGVGVTYFLPAFATVWTGNVDGLLAATVGALLAVPGGRSASRRGTEAAVGLLAGATAIFKLTPFAFVPAALRRGGSLARGTIVTLVGLAVLSLVLAPYAWADYVRVLPNLVAGSADYTNNLSPAVVLLRYGAPDLLVGVIRALMLGVALALLVGSVRLAAAPAGWPAAVACGATASLLVPGALWYHYLAILLPLAAFAWVRGGLVTRALLAASGGIVVWGLSLTPVAMLGAGGLAATVLAGLSLPSGRSPAAEPEAGA
jgi:hypothetical protein